jgi:hypothetical protein
MSLTGWAVDELKADAEVIRQAMGSLIGSAGGTVGAGGLELTQKGTPNMSVQIKGGTPAEGGLWIPGYTSTTGPYYFQNSATYEQPIEAAGASEPRVDTVVARMYDNALDSSGKAEPVFEVLKGKEESGVTKGNKKGIAAVPKNCYVLGYVFVERGVTKILTEDIENVGKKVSLGLPLPAESVGDTQIDSGRTLIATGTSWGIPKKYTKLEAELGVKNSSTRPSLVVFLKKPSVTVEIPFGEPLLFSVVVGVPYWVGPGQTVAANEELELAWQTL